MHIKIALVLFINFIASSYGQVFQKITFFSDVNQQGTQITLDDNQQEPSLPVRSSKSFCVELGLWELTVMEANVELTKVYGGGYGAKFCLNTIPETWTITSIKYLGARDLSTSSLTTFENVNFMGPSVTYDSVEEPSLELEDTFSSYFITGTNNFAVSSGNLTEVVTCLKTLKDGASTHGAQVQAYLESPLTMKSYRQGCEGDGDAPATRPPSGSGSEKVLVLNNFLLSITFILGFSVLSSFLA